MGQLGEYKEWEGQIIIVLCGSTDPNLRKELAEYVANEQDTLFEEQIVIIEK